MKIVIGQRFVSEMEPELGLGMVLESLGRQIVIDFPQANLLRRYSLVEPPIKRVIFKINEKIKDINDNEHNISEVIEKDALIYYRCGEFTIPETDLSNAITFNSPIARLKQVMFDDSETFDIRYTANIFRKDIKQSPARGFAGGRIDLLPHQFSVADKIIRSPGKRFFLSDEVGLGKTIEACIVLHKLLIEETISRVVIVVPPALVHQWFVELYRRFNILSILVNDDFIKSLNDDSENPFLCTSTLIISITDFTEKSNVRSKIIEAGFDMLIIDEAHHLVPTSKEYAAVKEISLLTEWILMLTATPEALSKEGFFSLLTIIDPVRFSNFESFLNEQKQYTRLAQIAGEILRGKDIPFDILCKEYDFDINKNIKVTTSFRKEIVERLNDIHGIGRAILRNSRSVIKGFPKRVVKMVPLDDKLDSWIKIFIRKHVNKKTLVICAQKDDAIFLHKKINEIRMIKVALFHEEMSLIQLDRNAAWFAEREGAQVLVASEIGSEGRNFQFADYLILTDLPMEPELLEQRIGRLDRIGRIKDILIYVPYKTGTFQQLLARWYNEGIKIFEQTVSGAYQIGCEFLPKLEKYSKLLNINDIVCDKLIADTTSFCEDLSKKIELGKNHLLELASFDPVRAKKIVDWIVKEDFNVDLHDFMERVFDLYGIAFDELGTDLFRLDTQYMTDIALPLPTFRSSEVTVTYNRHIALVREDAEFLSIDHPMITDILELLSSSQKGNCAFSILKESGEEGLLLELIFILETHSLGGNVSQSYFPAIPVRYLIDDGYEDVSQIFPFEYLSQNLYNGSERHFEEHIDSYHQFIDTAILTAQSNVEDKRLKYMKSAIIKLQDDYRLELARIKTLITNQQEFAEYESQLNNQHTETRKLILESSARLDSVRLIVLER